MRKCGATISRSICSSVSLVSAKTIHAGWVPASRALTSMRRAASHLAAVADPAGRVLGLVALEDVLEMLVGEVRDPSHRSAPGELVG